MKNLQFGSTTSNWGSAFPRPRNPNTGQFFTEYLGLNVQTDVNGNMLFYVISTEEETFLFDRNNKHVVPPDKGRIIPYSNFLAVCSPDISIVPYQEGVVYHILTAGRIWEYNLAKNQITAATNSNTQRMAAGSSLGYGAYNFSSNGYKYLTSTQAVRRLNNNCTPKYRTYSLVANGTQSTFRGIRVCEISESLDAHQVEDTVIQDYPITSYQGISTSFEYSQSEMELSNDGSKLALVENKIIFVFNLNTNGNISGVAAAYNYNTSSTRYAIAGVEFDGNNKLLYSVYDIYSTSWSGRGLYAWDISNNTHTKFSSSESFCLSSIEKGKDGHCYTSKQDGIYRLNLSNNTIVAHLTGITLTPRFDMFKKFYPSATVNNPVYYLPDQLDGQTSEFLDLTETVFTYNFGTLLSGSFNWNNSSHGFTTKGNGKVLVLNAINVPSTASAITLDGMTIEFYDDASFNLSPDAQVTLKGTILKGSACGLMWKGISMMKGSGRLSAAGSILIMQKNTAGQNTQLHDAYTGVDLFGNRNRLEVLDGTLFKANERHLRINEGDLNRIKIWESNFNGAQFLRDQERGDASGYGDGKRRTIDGILVINSNIRIGDASRLNNNIYGGQNGIYAIGSSLDITKANIHLIKKHGLLFNANQLTNKTLSLKQSFVHDLFKGVRIEGRTKETIIQQNTFHNTSAYGIEYLGNNGGKLKIGDETNVALGNSFNNCNWAAIQCDNNQRFFGPNNPDNSLITISNNSIDNHIYAAGISVSEPIPTLNASYGLFKVSNNKIGLNQRMGRGINLVQVTGGNPILPMDRNENFFNRINSNYEISSNTINFTQVFSPGANYLAGITADKTERLNFKANKINSGTWGDWRPVALKIWDCKRNIVADNELQGGVGLQPAGVGSIYSNYHCNLLKECVTGIQLGYTTLRDFAPSTFSSADHDDFKTHGHKELTTGNIYSRQNAFLPTPKGKGTGNRVAWGTDIQLYASISYERFNLWDFAANYELPKIDYPFYKPTSTGIVHNDKRNLICEASGIWGDKIVKSAPPPDTTAAFNYSNNVNDTINLKWNLDYFNCRNDVADGTTTLNYDSAIIKIVLAEKEISDGNYLNAKNIIATISSTNSNVIDFKTAYTIACEKLMMSDTTIIAGMAQATAQDTLWIDEATFVIDTITNPDDEMVLSDSKLSDTAVSILTAIAQKNVFLQSSAAHAARALLYANRQIVFDVEKFNFFPSVSGNLDSNCTWLGNGFAKVSILKSTGEETGIYTYADSSGYFWLGGGLINTLDSAELYYIAAQLSDSTWVTTDSARHHYQLDLAGFIHLSCPAMSPDIPAALKSGTEAADIHIFPNPSDGDIQIKGLKKDWEITVLNVAGQKIKQLKGNSHHASIQNLPSGLCIINITDNNYSRIKNAKIWVK